MSNRINKTKLKAICSENRSLSQLSLLPTANGGEGKNLAKGEILLKIPLFSPLKLSFSVKCAVPV